MSIVRIHPVGPVYVAVEREAEDEHIAVAWMHETEPPYRVGKALRLRLGHRALHFGVCRRKGRTTARGVEHSPEEIREWIGPSSL